jgi:hypothetical protein
MNLGAAFFVAFEGLSPELPPGLDQRLLAVQTWGWLVPFVWGFSARWLPVFLGLRPVRARKLLQGVAMNSVGVLAALAGWTIPASILILAGIFTAIYALRLFEPRERPAKVKGVHPSYPAFVRLAYVWAAIAATLGIWGSFAADPNRIAGASRHALTVGFLATMVSAVGQRVLPAFSGMRLLFSSKLMFGGCFWREEACCAWAWRYWLTKVWWSRPGSGCLYRQSVKWLRLRPLPQIYWSHLHGLAPLVRHNEPSCLQCWSV